MATKKLNTTEFIKRAIEIHDNKYDYSKVIYENIRTKIIIICKIHGEFEQRPNSHINNNKGCLKCNNDKYRSNNENFIEKAIKIHSNKYDYSLVNYLNNKTKVKIICSIHGTFEQIPKSHLNSNRGCLKCSFNVIGDHLRSNKEEFIKKAIKVNGNNYDYSLVNYINNHTHINILCINHNINFKQTPQKHLEGHNGCPKCNTCGYSKKQIRWLDFLSKYHNINIQHALNDKEFLIPTTRYRADGYCKETNTIYEFHGSLYHGDPKIYNQTDINPITKTTFGELYEKTLKKEGQIKELGYNLIVIWENDWDKLNKCVKIIQRKFRKKINK